MTHETRSPWPGRFALIAAALASIATSPARWHVNAPPTTLPPGAPGKGSLLVIESSHEPSINVEHPSRHLSRPVPAPGGARREALVPDGYKLGLIQIGDICSSGGCFDKCTPPPGASLRVASVDPVSVWERTATSAPNKTDLSPSKAYTVFRVEVESAELVDLEVVPSGGVPPAIRGPFVHASPPRPGASPPVHRFAVSWSGADGNAPPSPVSVTWTAHVRELGFCRGEGPCAPGPKTAPLKVSIKSE